MTWRRIERIGNAALFLGDSEALRHLLPANDALLCDPPYGISVATDIGSGDTRRVPFGGRPGQSPIVRRQKDYQPIKGDDRPFDPARWLSTKPTLMWGANYFAHRLPAGRWLGWDKRETLKPNCQSDMELAWTNVPGNTVRLHRQMWSGMVRRGDFWRSGQHGSRREHPTEKPVQLMAWCIRHMRLKPGAVILDPYMGVGTAGAAAVLLGHPYVGVEFEARYFDTACERLALVQRDPAAWTRRLAA